MTNDIIVYSQPDCPNCAGLKKKLDEAGIQYTDNQNINEMQELGIKRTPMLSVNGTLYSIGDAVRWINLVTKK
jgi:glutaredoxin